MIKSTSPLFCCAMLWLLLALGGCAGQTEEGQQPVTKSLAVDDIVVAIEQLKTIYNLPINFEDEPAEHRSEMQTGPRGLPMRKREPALTFTYEVPPDDAPLGVRRPLAAKALDEILHAYDKGRGSKGWYAAIPTKNGFDVVPTQYVNKDGQTERFQPILDTPISISPGERSLGRFAADVASALTAATGRKIVEGTAPIPLFRQYKTTVSATNEPARSVLRRFFDDIPVAYIPHPEKSERNPNDDVPTTLSWELKCVPPQALLECALNFDIVAPEGKPTVGKGPPLPPIEK